MRQAYGLGNATTDLRAAPGAPGLARAFAGVATPHDLCPDPGLHFPAPRTSCPRDHLYIRTHEKTVRQSPAACPASTGFSHFALRTVFSAPSTKHYALFLSHTARRCGGAQAQSDARPDSRRRMGLGPCRGACRTDRATGALAEFASAHTHFNPWRDCPARRCSPARTRGPAVSTCAARDCFVEGFAECGPRISGLRIRAIRGSLFSGLPGPPDFRRLPRFPHLWHQFPQAHGFVRRAAIPAYLEDPDNRAAAFSRDACFVPQRIHGVSCCPKEPRGVLLLDCYLSRTGPGAGTKKRPARGRMGFTLWRAAQNARAPLAAMRGQWRFNACRHAPAAMRPGLPLARPACAGRAVPHCAPLSFHANGGIFAMK